MILNENVEAEWLLDMRQEAMPSLVQIMACRKSETKPLFEQCWLIIN